MNLKTGPDYGNIPMLIKHLWKGAFFMFRRILCLLCAALITAWIVPACSESAAGTSSYDFDLTFHLNAESFPELLRSRAEGYASLVNRLGLRGTVSWSAVTQCADLEATLYYVDDASLSYPFRLYGSRSRVFFTSPLINNEILLLNMAALMEFSMKAKNTLGVPLSYVALLYPYTTTSAFDGLVKSWQDVIGAFTESGQVTVDQFVMLSDLWIDQVQNNSYLSWWISGLASGSDAPSAVEAEMNNLPFYYQNVTAGQSLSVSVSPGSEIWTNASGDTLFSSLQSDGSQTVSLSLPASQNGYVPGFTFLHQEKDQTFSFEIAASVRRDASAVSDGSISGESSDDDSSYDEYGYPYDDEYGYNEGYDSYDEYDESGYTGYDDEDEEDLSWDSAVSDFPDLMLDFHASGSDFPRTLPADSDFSLSVSVVGALYPDYAFVIHGTTKKDGAVTLSLSKPFSADPSLAEIFRCTGTFTPSVEPKDVPDYMMYASLENIYNVFSFNELTLAEFRSKVLPPLVKNVFSFIAAAPTSACQSFLDDLTDIGLLDMLLQ